MIIKREVVKSFQDFEENERTASDRRKQFRETKSGKEERILQKTGMKYYLTRALPAQLLTGLNSIVLL